MGSDGAWSQRVRAAVLALVTLAWARSSAADDVLASAAAARSQGRLDEAAQVLRQHLHHAPGDGNARRELAITLAWMQRWPEAIAQYHRLLARDPRDVPATIGLGRVLAWSGQRATSRHLLRALLATSPNTSEAWAALAATEAADGDEDAARVAYQRALALDASSVEAREGLARLRRALRPGLRLAVGSALTTQLEAYAALSARWPTSLRTELLARAATIADPALGTGGSIAIGVVHRRSTTTWSAAAHLIDAPGLLALGELGAAWRDAHLGAVGALQLRVGAVEPTLVARLGPSVHFGGVELAVQGLTSATAEALGEPGLEVAARFENHRAFVEARAVLATPTAIQLLARVSITHAWALGARATSRDSTRWLGAFVELEWP